MERRSFAIIYRYRAVSNHNVQSARADSRAILALIGPPFEERRIV